jgi:hypothetical protein
MPDRNAILEAIGERLGRVHTVDLEMPELILQLLLELAVAETKQQQQERQAAPAEAADDDK